MIKKTKRKGFNFFRSYYDVFNELNKEDKLQFVEALFNKQFHGIDPTNLTGLAKFAWISQVNSIDSQVKGYNDKAQALGYPPLGGAYGGANTPCQQVQEKGKEKGKEKGEVESTKENTINKFLDWFNNTKLVKKKTLGRFKTLTKTDINNLMTLKKSHDLKDFNKAVDNLYNSKWATENNMLTPSHFLRLENFNKYLNQDSPAKKIIHDASTF